MRIDQLIAELDSDKFKTRDIATKELEKLGEAAASAARKGCGRERPVGNDSGVWSDSLINCSSAKVPPEMLTPGTRRGSAGNARHGGRSLKLLERLAADGAPGAAAHR